MGEARRRAACRADHGLPLVVSGMPHAILRASDLIADGLACADAVRVPPRAPWTPAGGHREGRGPAPTPETPHGGVPWDL